VRGTRHHTDTLELVSITTTASIDPDTKARRETDTITVQWTGKGSLQATPLGARSFRATRPTAGGVEEVLVPHRAILPEVANPQPGWYVRAAGRLYSQLTEPVNPGGYWLLNLAPPA
jgi:hypothetical protein